MYYKHLLWTLTVTILRMCNVYYAESMVLPLIYTLMCTYAVAMLRMCNIYSNYEL